ncbi:MAG: alkaline phosphatase D family protein [Chitinophagales bacterium]|nr:alkaline phosphatase D family protein [Chitinophagales bacterium]MCZ2394386.1 alkaline phosphatase D family protein [Chitinophagales bacterium]
MKNLLLFFTFLSFFSFANAQYDLPERSYVNEAIAPFYHGVASGDATADKVIIWTRITTDAGSANVKWRIAKDSLMQKIVDEGVFTTDATRDFTVKVDVQDLEENTWYFFEFEDEQGRLSQRGRTKTTPISDISNFRAAVVSCASYPHGYFNVYDRISERNDINAVIHLGDYIYEYGLNEYGNHPQRKPSPENDIVTLSDYRTRYSQAHLDTMLQKLHQQYPFYNIWDDHEFANNSWRDGAENHNPAKQGDWAARKSAALQAYLEWVPIREIDLDDKFKIYRSLKIGNLAEIFFLDTRIIDRDNETSPDGPNKKLIGEVQMEWLQQGLKNSTAQWKVIAQQVMVAPMLAFGLTLNTDQWDGYTFERKRLFDFINNNNIKNIVVLTGDIHTFWANDLPFGKEPYNADHRENSAGVEFVCSAVSSPGLPFSVSQALLNALNPHIRDSKLDRRGFLILDLKNDRAQGDFYHIRTVNQVNNVVNRWVSYYAPDQVSTLFKNKEEEQADFTNIDFVPRNIRDKSATAIHDRDMGVAMGAYPNPFIATVGLQYYVDKVSNIQLQIFDMSGRIVFEKDLGNRGRGLYYDTVEAGFLPIGQYRINVTDGIHQIGRNVIKAQ